MTDIENARVAQAGKSEQYDEFMSKLRDSIQDITDPQAKNEKVRQNWEDLATMSNRL